MCIGVYLFLIKHGSAISAINIKCLMTQSADTVVDNVKVRTVLHTKW